MGMNSPSGHERQPLLGSNAEPSDRPRSRQWPFRGISALKEFLFANPIILCTFCLQFCSYFAKHMIEVPTIKLFEQAICNRYYSSRDEVIPAAGQAIDERLCKIPPIQNELAALTGLKFTFDALPGQSFTRTYQSLSHCD